MSDQARTSERWWEAQTHVVAIGPGCWGRGRTRAEAQKIARKHRPRMALGRKPKPIDWRYVEAPAGTRVEPCGLAVRVIPPEGGEIRTLSCGRPSRLEVGDRVAIVCGVDGGGFRLEGFGVLEERFPPGSTASVWRVRLDGDEEPIVRYVDPKAQRSPDRYVASLNRGVRRPA